MSFNREEAIKTLKLFNEKADKLLNSLFVDFIRKTKHFTVKLSANRGEAVRLEKLLPDKHAIDEFVLTFRFFIQDNETCSFRNMTKLYEEMPISQDLKDKFTEIAKNLNDFLDSEPQTKFEISGEKLKNRKIMEVFIYGSIAHANLRKKQIFDNWVKMGIAFPFLEFQFNSILELILRVIRYAKELNAKAIDELAKTG